MTWNPPAPAGGGYIEKAGAIKKILEKMFISLDIWKMVHKIAQLSQH
ncbi:MAG: hypothetical protein ABSF13_05760 [Smithella sp.]